MSDLTAATIRAKVHAAVDAHMSAGGCVMQGKHPADCVACSVAFTIMFTKTNTKDPA